MSQLKNFFNTSLETIDGDDPTVQTHIINALEITGEEQTDDLLDHNMVNAVYALEQLSDVVETLIAEKNTSPATARVVSTALESLLESEHLTLQDLGLEAYSEGAQDDWHEASLEALRDRINDAWDAITGGFDRKAKGKARELASAMASISDDVEKRQQFIKKHQDKLEHINVSKFFFDGLYMLLNRGGKYTNDPAREFERDAQMFERWGKFLRGDVLRYFKAIDSALPNKPIADDKEAEKLFADLAKIKNPVKDLSGAYYGIDALLQNRTLEYTDGGKPIKFVNEVGDLKYRPVVRSGHVVVKRYDDFFDFLLDGPLMQTIKSSHRIHSKYFVNMVNSLAKMADGGENLAKAIVELVDVYESIQKKLEIVVGSAKSAGYLSPSYRKDIKRLAYLNSYLKALVRNPGNAMSRHMALTAEIFNSLQNKIQKKIEKGL